MATLFRPTDRDLIVDPGGVPRRHPTDQGLSAGQIAKQIDASLKRLQTDYVDLYQAHRFDVTMPIEDTIEAFQQVEQQGKARYLGFSEWTPEQIQAAIDIARPGVLVSSQPQYSMLWQAPTLALAWVLRRGEVASAITGASRPEQVHANAQASGLNSPATCWPRSTRHSALRRSRPHPCAARAGGRPAPLNSVNHQSQPTRPGKVGARCADVNEFTHAASIEDGSAEAIPASAVSKRTCCRWRGRSPLQATTAVAVSGRRCRPTLTIS